MARREYKVDYHLICAIYFCDALPSGADLAQLWTGLKVLGSYPVEMSFVCQGDTEMSPLPNSTLGSPLLSDVFVSRADKIISAGASSVRPEAHNATLDSDLNFTFNRTGRFDGQGTPAILLLSISGQVIQAVGSTALLGLLRGLFDVADHHSPICGLIDLARPNDAFAGMVYGTSWPRTAPLARWVNHLNWVYSGSSKTDKLRGVYWGNYIGTRHLDRLGGRERFSQLCTKNARNHDGSPNARAWQLTNGLFLTLCFDPVDCRPDSPIGLHPAAEANLKWLIRELGSSGVLNSW
jgi:hypothetical protein